MTAADLFARGAAALDAGDAREAVDCLTRAVALAPRVPAAYRLRAKAHLALRDRPKAVADLAAAADLAPDDADLRAELAVERFRQREFAASVADCDAVLALDPARADVTGLRGRCRAALGDSTGAAEDFAAAAADPALAAVYLTERAKLHLEFERYAAAAADCDAALRAEPDSVPALEARALARERLDDLEGAAADFARAAELNPQSVAAHLGGGLVAARRGDWLAAEAAADAVLALRPGERRALELRKQALAAR